MLVKALLGMLSLASSWSGAATAARTPARAINIVHVVADDLGYDDLGFRNGHKTVTPAINERVAEGIVLSHYHTYKVCGPSRASIMTGRYPWGVGYYDMTGQEAVSLDYTLMPEILQSSGWKTAAIGKWDLGAWTKRYTPTFRGFGSFVGYYNAALRDYWFHGGSCSKGCPAHSTDLSNSSGLNDPAGVRPASDSVNGTYDADIFTREALRVLQKHGGSAADDAPGLYMYLAYQNVHTTGQDKSTVSGRQPFQAPCETVDQIYGHAATDAVKVLGSMVTELDYGIGNVTAALKAAPRGWLMLLTSDNGGPIDLGNSNFPLRGGKHTLWDGGVRVTSFVSGSLIPASRRGQTWSGLAHSSDIYVTVVVGVAGLTLPADTGPRPFDGLNLWPAIIGNLSSPRTEIIHQVTNNYTLWYGLKDPPVIRSGKYKLILGEPGDATIRKWPSLSATPVPFGLSNNSSRDAYTVEHGQGHCRSAHIVASKQIGSCHGPGCLFDLTIDESESNNLINDTRFTSIIAQLKARLSAAALTGPEWALPFNKTAMSMLNDEMCSEELKTGYFEPVRLDFPASPPPPPGPPVPSPEPVWKPCKDNMTKYCPCSRFRGSKVSGNKCHIIDKEEQQLCHKCGTSCCNRSVTVQKYCGA